MPLPAEPTAQRHSLPIRHTALLHSSQARVCGQRTHQFMDLDPQCNEQLCKKKSKIKRCFI